ncbi:uncharacterized protein LOC135493644, partial [Lineus longissimus]|uniref:uncharacterized protein LOC135493644 n=1 Tax=Lineus longissimus TaxID=88925 RepID=UPI00315DD68F
MVFKCVLYGCSKGPEKNIRSLHEFPSGTATRRAWKRFVNRTRDRWKGPSKSSRICSEHFERGCFTNFMAWSTGYVSKLEMKPNQCPTIYPEGTCSTLASPATTSRNMNNAPPDHADLMMMSPWGRATGRSARPMPTMMPMAGPGPGHAGMLSPLPPMTMMSPSTPRPSSRPTTTPEPLPTLSLPTAVTPTVFTTPSPMMTGCKRTASATPTPNTNSTNQPKKARPAVRKLELMRIVSSYEEAEAETTEPAPLPDMTEEDLPADPYLEPGMVNASTQCDQIKSKTRTVRCQANFMPSVRRPPHRSKGCQIEPAKAEVGVNCTLLRNTATATTDHDTDMEPDSEDDDTLDDDAMDVSMYEPGKDEEMLENDNFNFTSGSHVAEEKFIVFKSCLWELFASCPNCSKPCRVEERYRKGTKVAITQHCPDCAYDREWSSQPSYRGNIPAGNLQLSGAILFTGVSPTKTLRVLKAMNVVGTSTSTYHNHMTRFLVPTVLTTWEEEQLKLFALLKSMEDGLTLGGDGRSDSPGHCAKYGSYTILEERINKIIHQELVQSNEPGIKNSGAMEKEGLIRSFAKLKDEAELAIEY